jgi:microcystin-dependent protein
MALVYPLKNYDPGQYEGPVDTSVDQLVAFGFYPQNSGTPDLNVGIEREAGTSKLILKTASTNISLRIGGSEYAWLDTTGLLSASKLSAVNNLYSPNLDTAAAGALTIGGTNATSIALGKAGVTVDIPSLKGLSFGSTVAVFGQPQFKINELTDLLYQADKRFTVTNGNATYFDGSYDSSAVLPSDTTTVITINIANQSGVPVTGIVYAEGTVYVSFYYTNNTYTAIQLRVKANGVWYTSAAPTNISISGAFKVMAFTVSQVTYLTDIELSITTAATPVYLAAINYICDRWAGTELPIVSKYRTSNTVFGAFNVGNSANAGSLTVYGVANAVTQLQEAGSRVWTAATLTPVTTARQVIAGAGLAGGGALSADLTLNVVANADGSIVVAADSIQVGVLATDAQHGTRGGGTLHAAVVAAGAAGFMSGADKTKLDGIAASAQVNDTAAQILAKLITVDGAGSSLDADLLDGQQGSYYQAFLQKSMFGGYTYDSAVDLNTLNTTFEARFLQSNQTNGPGVSGMSYYFGLAGGDTSGRGIQLVADVANFWWRERSVGTWRKFWHDGNLVGDRSNTQGFLTTTAASRLADLNSPPYGFSYWDSTSTNRPYGYGTLLSWAYGGTGMVAAAGNWLFELGISTDATPRLVFRHNINGNGWSSWCEAWTNQTLTNLNQLTNGPGYASLASPTFTGTPAAPTAAAGTNTTQLATTAFVMGQAASTVPTGTLMAFAGSAAPAGYLLCTGAAVSRTTYAALFAVIGTVYGAGDGSTTFNIPDGRSRSVVGAGQGAGLTNRSLGSGTGAAWGEESHALSQAEMPSHAHADAGHNHGGAVFASSTHAHRTAIGFDSSGTLYCRTNALYMPMDGSDVQLSCKFVAGLTQVAEINGRYAFTGGPDSGAAIPSGSAVISSTGGGSAHNNMAPFFVASWIIKT